jgi:hypothetical protein
MQERSGMIFFYDIKEPVFAMSNRSILVAHFTQCVRHFVVGIQNLVELTGTTRVFEAERF